MAPSPALSPSKGARETSHAEDCSVPGSPPTGPHGSLAPFEGERVGERGPSTEPRSEPANSTQPGKRDAIGPQPEGSVAELRKAGRRRKQEGAVYTPAFITCYLVEQALGGVLKARFETLRAHHEAEAAGTARKALADPHAYDPATLNEPQRKALSELP